MANWWHDAYRPEEQRSWISAALIAPMAAPALLGSIALLHEFATRATGLSVPEILFGYCIYGGMISYVFSYAVGIPYSRIFAGFLAINRVAYIGGAMLLGFGFGLLNGRIGSATLFAFAALVNSLCFVSIADVERNR